MPDDGMDEDGKGVDADVTAEEIGVDEDGAFSYDVLPSSPLDQLADPEFKERMKSTNDIFVADQEDEYEVEDEDDDESESDGEAEEEIPAPDSPEAARMAQMLGLTAEQMSALGDDGVARLVDQLGGQYKPEEQSVESDAGDGDTPTQRTGDASAVEFALDVDREYIDDEVLKGMDQVASEMNRMRMALGIMDGHMNVWRGQQADVITDDFVAQIGEPYADVFGAGNRSGVTAQERANREALLAMAHDLGRGAPKEVSDRDLLQRALFAAFPEKVKEAAKKEIVSGVKKQSRRIVSRPTQRRTLQQEKSAMEQAADIAKQTAEDLGMPDFFE